MKIQDMTIEQLKRKANQSWDMAGLARQDGDKEDATRHTSNALMYEKEISYR